MAELFDEDVPVTKKVIVGFPAEVIWLVMEYSLRLLILLIFVKKMSMKISEYI